MKKLLALLIAFITIASPIEAMAAEIPGDGVLVVTTAASDDGSQLDKRIDQYNALPEAIKGAFKANGVTITLMSPSEASDSNMYMGWTSSMQCTKYDDGTYEITRYASSRIYLVSREKSDASTLLHESGHLVDNIYCGGWLVTGDSWTLSNSAEWQDLYSRYKGTISGLASTGPKNVYDASEAWAETFMNVCLDPDKVKREAPELYNYTVGVIESFSEYGDTSLPRESVQTVSVEEPAPETEQETVTETIPVINQATETVEESTQETIVEADVVTESVEEPVIETINEEFVEAPEDSEIETSIKTNNETTIDANMQQNSIPVATTVYPLDEKPVDDSLPIRFAIFSYAALFITVIMIRQKTRSKT